MDYLVIKIPLPPKRVLDVLGDWFFPLLFSGFMIARCVVHDGNRRLWADEILAYYPANTSFGHMFSSTADTINGTPPLYFILAWFWTAVCGKSGLALRLFSSFATAAAICLMFIVLRRAYGRLAAAAAWLVGISDGEILANSMQARFHTLIVAEVALGILLYQRIVAQRRPSMRLLIGNAFAHAAMVMTHYLGPLYSGAILAGFVLSGLARRKNPLRACLSVVAGWLAFIPWIPAFIRHSSLAKPAIWIPVPNIFSLKAFYDNFMAEFASLAKWVAPLGLAAFVLIILVTLFKQTPPIVAWRRTAKTRELPLLLLAPCILLVPVAVYFVSIRPGGTSVFLYKYFVPCLLGSTILFAHLASRAIELCFLIPKSMVRHAAVTLLVAVLSVEILQTGIDRVHEVNAQAMGTEPRPLDFPADLAPGEPVVIEHIHEFLKLLFYSWDPQRYVFVIDPEVGLAEGAGAANHGIMAALGRTIPEHFGGVKTTEEFLASAHGFWVKRGGMHWYPMRIEHNPLFVVDRTEGDLLVHVRRVE
jgi:hypothetical protein